MKPFAFAVESNVIVPPLLILIAVALPSPAVELFDPAVMLTA